MSSDIEQGVTSDDIDRPDGDDPAVDVSEFDRFDEDEWETIRSERDRYLDALQRSQADFANYRKRAVRDQGAAREQARCSVLRSVLPLIDALDQAREHDDRTAPLWAVALDVLAREDVERIAPLRGEPFDPTLHDAVSSTGSGGDLVIDSVVRAGYRVAGHVLRPADVEVTTTGHLANATATSDGVCDRSASGDDTEEV